MLNLKMIQGARTRIEGYIYKTPLIHSQNLEEDLGCEVYLKCENMQRTNSFKIRGGLNSMLSLSKEELEAGVITASSGNHGKAIAMAAKLLEVDATIVVPDTIPKVKAEGIESYGADLIYADPAERIELAKNLSREKDYKFIAPFDNYQVMAGQGTAGLEILEDLKDIDTIVIPIGGGGLISGIATAIKETNPNIRVIGVEPTNTCRYTRSFEAGQMITLPSDARSVADGTSTLRPGERNYPIVERYVDEIVTVDEDYILKGTHLLLNKAKILAEITSGQVIGAVLQGKLKFKSDEKVVFLISGGNIGLEQIPSMTK